MADFGTMGIASRALPVNGLFNREC